MRSDGSAPHDLHAEWSRPATSPLLPALKDNEKQGHFLDKLPNTFDASCCLVAVTLRLPLRGVTEMEALMRLNLKLLALVVAGLTLARSPEVIAQNLEPVSVRMSWLPISYHA